MALQADGTIKFSEVQAEFGGTNPISISEYYGSDTVPASGVISLSDFYGTSSVAVTLQNASASDITFGGVSVASLTAGTDGTSSGSGNAGVTAPAWWSAAPDVGIGSDYEIRATLATGDAPTSGTLNTWLSLGTARTWSQSQAVDGQRSCTLTIEIRDSATQTVQGTATWSLSVDRSSV
jgi:hypothetical protein